MIPRTLAAWQSQSWQEQLINLVRDPRELCERLELDYRTLCETGDQLKPAVAAALQQFPLRVSHSFIQRMRKGDWEDPLLRQVLPSALESETASGYSTDPLDENAARRSTGIIQKYHGRVLLMVNSSCAVHCRYCFRRHFPYDDHRQSRQQWREQLEVLARDPSIHEVILSGGDPLTASNRQLAWLTQQIAAMDHVHTLRIHTRLPIIIPDRIDAACIDWLGESLQGKNPLKIVMVIHSNHANELDRQVGEALQRLAGLPITLLNQSVLLKGVNDSVDALSRLSETLFQRGVLPYYLHLLDKVEGTHHFDLPLSRAHQLHDALKARLPGYLVPKLAREIPGETNKRVLG